MNIECQRCGGCCILGPCRYGKEDPENGSCIFLRFEKDIAFCMKVEAGNKDVISAVGIGKGCILRNESAKISIYLDTTVKSYKELMGL